MRVAPPEAPAGGPAQHGAHGARDTRLHVVPRDRDVRPVERRQVEPRGAHSIAVHVCRGRRSARVPVRAREPRGPDPPGIRHIHQSNGRAYGNAYVQWARILRECKSRSKRTHHGAGPPAAERAASVLFANISRGATGPATSTATSTSAHSSSAVSSAPRHGDMTGDQGTSVMTPFARSGRGTPPFTRQSSTLSITTSSAASAPAAAAAAAADATTTQHRRVHEDIRQGREQKEQAGRVPRELCFSALELWGHLRSPVLEHFEYFRGFVWNKSNSFPPSALAQLSVSR